MRQNYTVDELCVGTMSNCHSTEKTRYKGTSPAAVAKKVANRIAREHGLGIYYITVRNCTREANPAIKVPRKYKVRVLRTTKEQKDKAKEQELLFVPVRFARIEKVY